MQVSAIAPPGYGAAKTITSVGLAEGSRYGPLDPPYYPWNIDNHYASDEKTWGSAAPKDYVIDALKPTPASLAQG